MKAIRNPKMSSKKKRGIDPEHAKEGLWLIAAMKAAGKKNVELAAEMGLNNDNLVSQWRTGYTPMSDLQMLKAGKLLNADAYQARPRLIEYKDVVGTGGVLEGLRDDAKQHALQHIAFLRAGAMDITKDGSANPLANPDNVRQLNSGDGGKPKKPK